MVSNRHRVGDTVVFILIVALCVIGILAARGLDGNAGGSSTRYTTQTRAIGVSHG